MITSSPTPLALGLRWHTGLGAHARELAPVSIRLSRAWQQCRPPAMVRSLVSSSCLGVVLSSVCPHPTPRKQAHRANAETEKQGEWGEKEAT